MPQNEITLRIEDLSRGGAGVGRDPNGRVIFVPFTAPGDLVRIEVHSETKRYAEGTLLELKEASNLRVEPRCPVFGKCGGCQWQHLPYEYQWETKKSGVAHALARVGINADQIQNWDEFPAQQVWEYRNRVQLRGFRNEIGFFKRHSRVVVPAQGCPIARPEINRVWEETRKEGFSRPPYKVEIEVMPNGEIRKTWNSRHSAAGFRQIHDEQNSHLQDWIAKVVEPQPILYDLYGGSGNLSLKLIPKFQKIHCVDLGAPEGKKGKNSLGSIYFHKAAVAEWVSKQSKLKDQDKDLSAAAILDPPREGVGSDFAVISTGLRALNVRQVVAVGCDPDAWARDILRWIRCGWKIDRILTVDLFPQTAHIEAVASLWL